MRDGFRSPGPTFRVDGRAQPDLARDVIDLEIEHGTGGLRSLVARFAAAAPRNTGRASRDAVEYLDGEVFDFGRVVDVALGPDREETMLFTGKLSAFEAGFTEGDVPHVEIAAEDSLMAFRLTQRSRTYTRTTDAEIVQTLAREHGLRAEVDFDGPRHELVVQANQSDLAFLRMRLERLGIELWAAGRTVHAASRDRRRGKEVTLVQGGHLIAVTARADLADQASAVRVSGFDARRKSGIDAEARLEAVRAEVRDGTARLGGEVLEAAFGAQTGRRSRDVPLDDETAASAARAELLRRARGFVRITGTTAGSPEIDVGARITLDRCGRPFDGGDHYVTAVRHRFSRHSGFRTDFVAERPFVRAFT